MNCEDVPLNEWDKLTGAEEEAKEDAYVHDCQKEGCLPGGYSHR